MSEEQAPEGASTEVAPEAAPAQAATPAAPKEKKPGMMALLPPLVPILLFEFL